MYLKLLEMSPDSAGLSEEFLIWITKIKSFQQSACENRNESEAKNQKLGKLNSSNSTLAFEVLLA